MKIYVASSWKNETKVRALTEVLREHGHEVFAFIDPEGRAKGMDNFVFNAEVLSERLDGRPVSTLDHIEFMQFPETQRAFESDKAGVDWAEAVILVLPSGRSAHLEAGYAVGKNKFLFIWGDLPQGEFDCMYGFATSIYRGDEIDILLKRLDLTDYCETIPDFEVVMKSSRS